VRISEYMENGYKTINNSDFILQMAQKGVKVFKTTKHMRAYKNLQNIQNV